MASPSLSALAAATLCCFVLAFAATDPLLDGINQYRTGTLKIGALSTNAGATCVAKKLLGQYESTACSNSTGLDTVPGQEPNYPDFPTWLSDCSVTVDRVKDALILPDCVPSGVAASDLTSTAVTNYTESVASKGAIGNANYTSAGVASAKDWYILILATKSSSGDYLQSASSLLAPSLLSLAIFLIIPFLSFFVYDM
eukprot:c4661_g1_i1 orf=199-792(+)